MLDQQLAQRDGLQVARVAGVPVVELVRQLGAGDANLPGIQHDQVVAHVHVRAVVGLVLAPQAVRKLRGQTAQGLALGVDDIPVARALRRV